VVRIAPNELSFTDARAWKDIYGNRAITKNRIWAGQEEEHRPISLLSTDEATHLRNRRALTGAFTEHAITEHAAVLEGLIGLMMQKFENAITAGQGRTVVDLTDWLSFLIFDISGTLSFGRPFDSVENGVAHPWVEISCSFSKGIALMASINFYRPLNHLLKFALPISVIQKMEYHKQLVHEKLQQRLEQEHNSNVQDYVGSVMNYNEKKGEVKIPKDEIESNLRILIFAGSETSSTAMTAILTYLLQNPKAYANVQEEVRDAFRDAPDITTTSVGHLEYLTAVIQEGLRLAPAAPVGVPRVTPKEGAEILGQFVPGKVSISFHVSSLEPSF
jgi:cytochrome P450